MKKRALAVAARHLIWTNVALGAALAGPAFAQTAPAADAGTNPGAAAGAAAAPAAASGSSATTTTTDEHGTKAKLKTFEVTGSLIRQTDKTGFNAVQTVSQKDIMQSGETTVAGYLQSLSANSASSAWLSRVSTTFISLVMTASLSSMRRARADMESASGRPITARVR